MTSSELAERLLSFAAEVIKLVARLSKSFTGRHVGRQLLRAATSSGANYEEACGAESKADFVHKLQIVFKELKEANYWLRLIERSELILNKDPALGALLKESKELVNIIAKSVLTAKGRRN